MRYQTHEKSPLAYFNVRVGLSLLCGETGQGAYGLGPRAQFMAVFVTTNEHGTPMKAPGWPADLSGTGADHSYPRMQDTRSMEEIRNNHLGCIKPCK